MQRLQAFKYELMPNGEQVRKMRQFAGMARFVFNRGLALQKARYEAGDKKLGYAALCKELTGWRNSTETPWLKDAPIHPLQQSLKDLERAYANFFAKRADFPRFKKKGRRDSFRYPDPKQIRLDQGNRRIFLPKLGWLRFRKNREVLGTVKNVTVSQSGGRWFVSIQTEREIDVPVPKGGAVGIDMGVARFATLSDGSDLAPFNSFKRHQTALRKAQQSLSRKTKFSQNGKKAKARIQKIQARIANARRDYLHKASATISQNQCAFVATLSELQGTEHPVATGCKALCLPDGEIPKGKIACTEKLRERKLPSSRCVAVKADMAKPDWLNPRQDWDKANPILKVTYEYVPAPALYVVCNSECHGGEAMRDKRNSHTGCLSRSKTGCVVTEGSPKGSNPYGDGAFIVVDTLKGNTTHVMVGEGEGKQGKHREESTLW